MQLESYDPACLEAVLEDLRAIADDADHLAVQLGAAGFDAAHAHTIAAAALLRDAAEEARDA